MAAARFLLLAVAFSAALSCVASQATFTKVTANPDKHAIISCGDARDTQRFTAYMSGGGASGAPSGTVRASLSDKQESQPSLLCDGCDDTAPTVYDKALYAQC